MVVSMRIMGKRQLGELEPAELVVAVLISDIAANPLSDPGTPLAYGLIPIITLVFCEIILSFLVLKFRPVRTLVSGSPSLIIKNGDLDQIQMKKDRYTIDELMEHLRKSGITDISAIKHATLETDGTLSVTLYAAESPATPKQHGLQVDEKGVPTVLVSDGKVIKEGLQTSGHNRKWLMSKIHAAGYSQPSEVFLMTVDDADGMYIKAREHA